LGGEKLGRERKWEETNELKRILEDLNEKGIGESLSVRGGLYSEERGQPDEVLG